MADGGIWRNCRLHRHIRAGALNLPDPKPWPQAEAHGDKPYVIVADDAFAMTTYLLKPYCQRQLNHQQRIFNYRLSRARRIVENAFGIMSSRFRLLLGTIFKLPRKVVPICLAIAALHNYLRKDAPAMYVGSEAVDQEDANHQVVEGAWRRAAYLQSLRSNQARNYSVAAKKLRDEMAVYFCSEEGSVPWQEQAIM